MPLPVIEADHLHLRIWCSYGAQASCTNFHYRVNSIAVNTDLRDLARAFDQHCSDEFTKAVSPLARYEGVQLALMNPLNPGKESSSENSGEFKKDGQFEGGVGLIPTQDRGLIKSRIPVTQGKGGHCRKYIPFPDIVALDPATGDPTGAYVIVLDALATQFGPAVTLTVKGQQSTFIQQIYMKNTLNWADVPLMRGSNKFATQRRAGMYGKANISPV